jgi:hypothetical protein
VIEMTWKIPLTCHGTWRWKRSRSRDFYVLQAWLKYLDVRTAERKRAFFSPIS